MLRSPGLLGGATACSLSLRCRRNVTVNLPLVGLLQGRIGRSGLPVDGNHSFAIDSTLRLTEHGNHIVLVGEGRRSSVVDINRVPHLLLVAGSNIIITVLLQGVAAVNARVNSRLRCHHTALSLLRRRLMRC